VTLLSLHMVIEMNPPNHSLFHHATLIDLLGDLSEMSSHR